MDVSAGGHDSATSEVNLNKLCDKLRCLIVTAQSDDQIAQLEAIRSARKLLSKENALIDEFIKSGIVPILVESLRCHDNPNIQLEVTWALTNITSGTSQQTRVVIECGAVPLLIELLSSLNQDLCEQAVWALGNIAADNPECRDLVISHGIIPPLLIFINPHTPISFLRNVTRTICILCRNKNPPPPFESVCKFLPFLLELVRHEYNEVKADACWALFFLSDGLDVQMQVVINSGIIPFLVPLLEHHEVKIVMPALRTLGNIVTGSDEQTQVVIDNGILHKLQSLLTHHEENIVREAVWTLTNITVGSKEQVQAVIDSGLIPPLVKLLGNEEFIILKHAAEAVSNFTFSGTPNQIKYLVSQEAIPPLCSLLEVNDLEVIQVVLEGLLNILRHSGEEQIKVVNSIEESGGLNTIENLQLHDSPDINEPANTIIDQYFPGGDGIDGLAPDGGNNQYFLQHGEYMNFHF
ncbi:Importin subunit alpha-4 isoform X2 [Oopsacas minuta]|uniref:Importin subunit alpha n=1 Tax=Oopsacas minuta TaxID=111878 RepID=A0AAV7K5Q9_9METZ|nr:Importin subunit alpha-4 isoform X2 [Oopsacas minuta]